MSSTSSKANQSQAITQKAISSTQAQGFSAEEQSDTQSKALSNVLEPKSKVTVREGSSSPQDEQVFASSGSTSMSPGSGSDQPPPLVSGPEMQLVFPPGVLHRREFSDESPKNEQTHTCKDTEDLQTLNLASAALLLDDEEKSLTEFMQMFMKDGPEVPTGTPEFMEITSRQSGCDGTNNGPGSSPEPLPLPESPRSFCAVVEPSQNSEFSFEGSEPTDTEQLPSEQHGDATTAQHPAHRPQEDPRADIPQMIDQELEVCSHHFDGVSEEVSPTSTQDDGTHYREESSFEAFQSEDVSSLSDATPETVTSARHFSFEELVLGPFLAPPPVDSEYFGSSVTTKSETSLSSSEGDSSPGGVDTASCPRSTAEYPKVEPSGGGSPGVDSSDPEGYFDCRQAASDLSEPDEPEPGDRLSSAPEQVLPSSESEEYEDAPFVHQPPHVGRVDSGEWSHSLEPSDDEFTLCEASQPPACSPGDATDGCLTRVRRAAVQLVPNALQKGMTANPLDGFSNSF